MAPVLPTQPVGLAAGQHDLGSRGQQRSGPLERAALRSFVLTRSESAIRRAWTGRTRFGLKKGDEDTIVAFFLRTGIGLSYAYSNDRDATWNDYGGNPVINPQHRRIDSPKPFWHDRRDTGSR